MIPNYLSLTPEFLSQTRNGQITAATPSTDVAAVTDHESGRKLFREARTRRQLLPRLVVESTDACVAQTICDRLGTAADAGIVIRVARLLRAGKVSEFAVWDAVEAVRVIGPRNPLAYFRSVLAQNVGAKLLADLLAAVRLPKSLDVRHELGDINAGAVFAKLGIDARKVFQSVERLEEP